MNITLIGMPGAGKSTVGVVFSKISALDFTDTDLIIQKKYRKKLPELIDKYGTEAFLDLERDAIVNYPFENTVIATGGSVVYKEETMNYLKSISKIVYISVDIDELKKRVPNLENRGVVGKNATTLEEIFKERCALYEKYADYTVHTTGCTLEESALKIYNLTQKFHN